MSGAIFKETLRRSWRTALYLGLGVASMALYCMFIIPDDKTLKQVSGLVQSFPVLVSALGGGDAAFLGTPEGMLNYAFFSWIVLLLAGYAVIAGLNITSSEEDRGIMDILLSAPVPRWRVVVEKFLAYMVVVAVAVLIGYGALIIGVQYTIVRSMLTIGTPARFAESSLNMLPSTLIVLAFTALVATLIRRRNVAAAIASVFVVASFFIEMIGRSAPSADNLRLLSFYSYYDSAGVMKDGLAWGNVAGLLAVTVLMVAGAAWAFHRRDINV
jgi:beta-exotoxin I transport system permease protein